MRIWHILKRVLVLFYYSSVTIDNVPDNVSEDLSLKSLFFFLDVHIFALIRIRKL